VKNCLVDPLEEEDAASRGSQSSQDAVDHDLLESPAFSPDQSLDFDLSLDIPVVVVNIAEVAAEMAAGDTLPQSDDEQLTLTEFDSPDMKPVQDGWNPSRILFGEIS